MNHTNVVDVKAWIDTRPVSRFQWNVLLLCFIIIMLDGYDAAVMGFVAPAPARLNSANSATDQSKIRFRP